MISFVHISASGFGLLFGFLSLDLKVDTKQQHLFLTITPQIIKHSRMVPIMYCIRFLHFLIFILNTSALLLFKRVQLSRYSSWIHMETEAFLTYPTLDLSNKVIPL